MKNQTQMVLDYILEHGSIDQWRAMNELHILRLSARIYDLKRQGVPVYAVIRSRKTDGGTIHWAEYRIKEPPVSAKTDDSKGVAVATPLPSNNNTFFEGGQT